MNLRCIFPFSSIGIESFSKLGDSIYFEEKGNPPGLYIIQYISSSLDWKSGQVVVSQSVEPVVSWDNCLRVTIMVSSKGVCILNLFCSFIHLLELPYLIECTTTISKQLYLKMPFFALALLRLSHPGFEHTYYD